jgi:hypothetical protein
MIVDKKSKADIEAMLRKDYHWGDLHVGRGLDGMMSELQ